MASGPFGSSFNGGRVACIGLAGLAFYAWVVTLGGGGANSATPDRIFGDCLTYIPAGYGRGAHWEPRPCDQPGVIEVRPGEEAPPPPPSCVAAGMDGILATIRTRESGGRYGVGPNAGGASGAYQFIQSTWNATARRAGRPDLAGTSPYRATPADQDTVARQHVTEALGGTDDPARIPVVWYVGSFPPAAPYSWDTVPNPGAGNRLTVRDYQSAWMATYRDITGGCP
jgi:hypothetical protein